MPPSNLTESNITILIVDDMPENLQLLGGMLRKSGYKVRPVASGALAIQAATLEAPDLVLLDISMPDMSGYEVCEYLKARRELREVPVVFISGRTETIDKVRAFAVGGVDYVTKPFQFEEVEARVRTHLMIHRLQIEVERRNRDLQQSNNDLRQLQELRDNLTHMIVHDLRSPLSGAVGFLNLLAVTERGKLSRESAHFLSHACAATNKTIEMVNSLLDVSKLEAGQLELHYTDCDLVVLAREALTAFESLRGRRQLDLDTPAQSITICADRDLLVRVFQNLIGNALRFVPDTTGSVQVAVRPGDTARVSVADNGPGIPPEFHQRIFEKFGQVKTSGSRVGTGLGLTFCKLAIEAHGGRIGVESNQGRGSLFWFEIPNHPNLSTIHGKAIAS